MTFKSHRPVRRCPNCGSRLPDSGRQCAICGSAVPWRFTPHGMVVESLIVVVLVGLAITGMLWLRRSWSASLVPVQVAVDSLVTARPTDVPTFTPQPSAAPAEPSLTPAPPAPTKAPETAVHVIVSGDSLYGIALQYGVTIDQILAANEGMTIDSFLGIGQELRVPAARSESDGPPDEPVTVAEDDATATPVPGASDAATSTAVAVVPDGPPTGEASASGGAGSTAASDTAGVAAAGTGESGSGSAGESVPERMDGVGEGSARRYGPPLLLAPGHGQVVGDDLVFLRWASAGLLAPGDYYVVLLREAPEGAADAVPAAGDAVDPATASKEWILTNATALRLPSAFRPAFGTSSEIQWTVGIRRRANGLLTDETGVPLGPNASWRTFTWSPGAVATESQSQP